MPSPVWRHTILVYARSITTGLEEILISSRFFGIIISSRLNKIEQAKVLDRDKIYLERKKKGSKVAPAHKAT